MGSSNTTSVDPLAYVGIDRFDQPRFNRARRAPTANDKLIAGTQWFDETTSIIFISKGDGIWDQVAAGGGGGGVATINTISPDGGGNFGIVAGSNITVTPGVNSITIASTASAAFTWSAQATGTALLPNEGFISTNAGAQSFPLPTASCPIGTVLELTGGAAGLVTITQAAGQSIRIGNTVSTTGATGSVASSVQGDALKLVCTVANTTFQAVTGVIGNWTVI